MQLRPNPGPSSFSIVILGLCWLIVLITPAARAATPVHADPNLTCAGLTPCFETIQEAVDNAGPAPAEVLIFPGTYAESVTLGTMGSAIAGNPGDISLQAVDAAGQPATAGVVIDPSAAGGPGTGTGLNSGLSGAFPGDVTLVGLSATSPDSAGIGLSVDGNLVAEDLLVSGAASSGLVGETLGNARLARIEAELNGDMGLALNVDGNLQAVDLQAIRNSGDGIVLRAIGDLQVQAMTTPFNGNGAMIYACTNADVQDAEATGNSANGISILFGPGACTPTAQDFGLGTPRVQMDIPSKNAPLSAPKGVGDGTLYARNLLAENSAQAGIGIASSSGSAQLEDLYAYLNDGPGMVLQAESIVLDGAEAAENLSGVIVLAESADLLRVAGNQSQPMPASPPNQGSGILISANDAVLDDLQADDNPAAGLLLTDAQNGGTSRYQLIGSQFDGNLNGIQIDAANPVELNIGEAFVTNNTAVGLLLPQLGNGTFREMEISGNPLGLSATIVDQFLVETSTFDANGTGSQLVVETGAQAAIRCSNFTQNAQAGLELVQGNMTDADANFWGDASGPTHPLNSSGTGDSVIDSENGGSGLVDYRGFLTQPATAADCSRGLVPPVSVPVFGTGAKWLLVFGVLLLALAILQSRRVAFMGP